MFLKIPSVIMVLGLTYAWPIFDLCLCSRNNASSVFYCRWTFGIVHMHHVRKCSWCRCSRIHAYTMIAAGGPPTGRRLPMGQSIYLFHHKIRLCSPSSSESLRKASMLPLCPPQVWESMINSCPKGSIITTLYHDTPLTFTFDITTSNKQHSKQQRSC